MASEDIVIKEMHADLVFSETGCVSWTSFLRFCSFVRSRLQVANPEAPDCSICYHLSWEQLKSQLLPVYHVSSSNERLLMKTHITRPKASDPVMQYETHIW